MSFALRYVRCGKASCKSCPHGPYWYEYNWDRKTGRMKSRYIGRNRDSAWEAKGGPDIPPVKPAPEPWPAPKPHRFDQVFSRRTCNVKLCAEILGVAWPISPATLKATFRRIAVAQHPDHGGDAREFKWSVAAFSYLCAALNVK